MQRDSTLVILILHITCFIFSHATIGRPRGVSISSENPCYCFDAKKKGGGDESTGIARNDPNLYIQGNFGRYRCAAEIAKTPQCIYCYLMKPEFTCYNLFDNLDAILPVLPVSEVWNMGYSAPWILLNNLFSSPSW
jgi:hypothetical protein